RLQQMSCGAALESRPRRKPWGSAGNHKSRGAAKEPLLQPCLYRPSRGRAFIAPPRAQILMSCLFSVATRLQASGKFSTAMTQSRDRLLRRVGLASFAGVVLKSLVEALTGEILFASSHLGWLGTPIRV